MHQSLPKTIDYIEMPSRDLEATEKFFTALLGWSFTHHGTDYIAFDDGRMTGGFFDSEDNWMSSSTCPLIVFYSENLEESRAEVVRYGAKITREIFEFPGGRRFAFCAPGTGEFAIWSDK